MTQKVYFGRTSEADNNVKYAVHELNDRVKELENEGYGVVDVNFVVANRESIKSILGSTTRIAEYIFKINYSDDPVAHNHGFYFTYISTNVDEAIEKVNNVLEAFEHDNVDVYDADIITANRDKFGDEVVDFIIKVEYEKSEQAINTVLELQRADDNHDEELAKELEDVVHTQNADLTQTKVKQRDALTGDQPVEEREVADQPADDTRPVEEDTHPVEEEPEVIIVDTEDPVE